MFKKRNAYSLLELVMVIALIGVLCVLAINGLYGYSEKSKVASAKAGIDVIATAEQKYLADHSTWINGVETETIAGQSAMNAYCNKIPSYLSVCPKVPHPSGKYIIKRSLTSFDVQYEYTDQKGIQQKFAIK